MSAITIPAWLVWMIGLGGIAWCGWVTRSLLKILSASQLSREVERLLYEHVTDYEIHGAGLTVLRGRVETLEEAILVLRREHHFPATPKT